MVRFSRIWRPVSWSRDNADVRHNLAVPDLDSFITEVIDSVRPSEREVHDKDGRWFSLRVRPYITPDNKVDGAVVVLVDINDLPGLDYHRADPDGTIRVGALCRHAELEPSALLPIRLSAW